MVQPLRLFLFLGMAFCVGCGTLSGPSGQASLGDQAQTSSSSQSVRWLEGELPQSTQSSESYDVPVIKPLDTLNVEVFETPDLSGEYQVGPAGNIRFPLIGRFEAAGYTSQEFSARLEAALAADYLQNPHLNVKHVPVETNLETIAVDGEVRDPDIYKVSAGTTLQQAIAQAGGATTYADLKRVVIFRQIDGRKAAATYNLKKIRSGLHTDPILYGNDVILVENSGTKRSRDEILKSLPLFVLFGL